MEEEKMLFYARWCYSTLCVHSINVLTEAFEGRLISRKLWPAGYPGLNPCDFYLWEDLKDILYSSNPHTFGLNNYIF
jgi:hypothetical protein